MTDYLGRPENQEFSDERYSPVRSRAARQLEQAALGHAVGLNGYTTLEQAQVLTDCLELSPDRRLLDVGAGRGWPGSHIASASGCHLFSTDVPRTALREATGIDLGREHSGLHYVIGADGRAFPFALESFDAISHADVFC